MLRFASSAHIIVLHCERDSRFDAKNIRLLNAFVW